MHDVASANQKKKTDQNAKHYSKRNNVGAVDIEAGDLVLERDGQFGNKMRGRLALGGTGPFRVTQVVDDAVTFVKNGKRKTLRSWCVKKYRARESMQV